MPVTCRKTDQFAPLIEWLRSDVRRYTNALAALVMNIPSVPRTVFAAHDAGTIAGVLICTEFPWCTSAEFAVDDAKVISALAGCLTPGLRYLYTVPCEFREALLAQIGDVDNEAERLDYTVGPENLIGVPLPGEARALTPDDFSLLSAFPRATASREPTLSDHARWAAERPDRLLLHGLIVDGQLVCYADWAVNCDPVWEVSMIRTHPDHLRTGYAKALLSYSTAEILAAELVPWYHPANDASRRTCESVGYRPHLCRFSCEGVRAEA